MDDFFVEDEPLEAVEAAFAAGRRVVTAQPGPSRQAGALAQTPGRFELFTTGDGQFRFTLKAANGVIIATSETYSTEAAALRAIESVKATAAAARVDSLAG